MKIDKNDLAYWFPKLAMTGVPVPETAIITTDINLSIVLDGNKPDGFDGFVSQLSAQAYDLGLPVFLRTGHGSDKHSWSRSCYITDPSQIPQRIANLVEWSECVDILGLPYRNWAVRKFLSLQTAFTAFRDFPVNRERRYFVSNGKVLCHHPYWPEEAVEQGRPSDPDWRQKLSELNSETTDEIALLTGMSEHVSRSFEGAWSLDWAETDVGDWYAIDMALADRSYHWPSCPHAEVML